MRLRRELETANEMYERRLLRLEKALAERRMQQLESTVKALQQQVSQLERAEHGHCVTCGEQTHHYAMTHCGRANCQEAA